MLERARSYNAWFRGLTAIGVVNVGILIAGLFSPSLLHPNGMGLPGLERPTAVIPETHANVYLSLTEEGPNFMEQLVEAQELEQ